MVQAAAGVFSFGITMSMRINPGETSPKKYEPLLAVRTDCSVALSNTPFSLASINTQDVGDARLARFSLTVRIQIVVDDALDCT